MKICQFFKDLINLQKSNPSLYIIKLDVEDDESIEHAKTEVEKILSNDPLNILINNAGIGERVNFFQKKFFN